MFKSAYFCLVTFFWHCRQLVKYNLPGESRRGIDVGRFEKQMDDIERDWSQISSVFGSNVVQGLNPDGTQRTPDEIWRDISSLG